MTKKEKARKPKPRSAKKLSDLEFSTVSDIPLGEADAGLGGMFTKSRLWNFWNSGTYSNRIKPEMEFIAEIKDLVNELSAQPFRPVTNLCKLVK